MKGILYLPENFFKFLICLSLMFQHITKSIRDLLGIEDPSWSKSISLPPRDELGIFTSAFIISVGKF